MHFFFFLSCLKKKFKLIAWCIPPYFILLGVKQHYLFWSMFSMWMVHGTYLLFVCFCKKVCEQPWPSLQFKLDIACISCLMNASCIGVSEKSSGCRFSGHSMKEESSCLCAVIHTFHFKENSDFFWVHSNEGHLLTRGTLFGLDFLTALCSNSIPSILTFAIWSEALFVSKFLEKKL